MKVYLLIILLCVWFDISAAKFSVPDQRARSRAVGSLSGLNDEMKVLTHETGHMFGVRHCVYYHCNMNGANHLGEADATPLHLCPMCLRKMQHTIKFSPEARYKKLASFYKKYGFNKEAEWASARVMRMKKANPSKTR